MKKIVLVWQRLHFVIYKFTLGFDNIIGWPFYKILNNKWVIKQYQKRGVNNPAKLVREATTRPDIGPGNWMHEYMIRFIAYWGSMAGLIFICAIFGYCSHNAYIVAILPVVPGFLFTHYASFKDDKFLLYFKEFDKAPKKMKWKWAWQSLGVVILVFSILVLSVKLMTWRIHK